MTNCICGKRSFHSEHDAQRALGRTQTKRARKWDKQGSRRGLTIETRWYVCDQSEREVFHLTHMNRRTFEGLASQWSA